MTKESIALISIGKRIVVCNTNEATAERLRRIGDALQESASRVGTFLLKKSTRKPPQEICYFSGTPRRWGLRSLGA